MESTRVFGVPLDTLVLNDRKKHPNLQVPYVIKESVKCITRHGIDSEGVFRISGNKEKVAALIELINKGTEIDFVKEKSNPNDVCSLFKQFLRECPEPILTFGQYEQWIKCHNMDKEEQLKTMKELIDALPKNNRSILNLIIPFFAKIAQNSKINKMDASNISKTVGPNLLWKNGGGDSVDYLINSSKINDIVQLMIEESKFLFPESSDDHAKWATFEAKVFGHQRSVQCMAVGYHSKELWSCDSNGAIRVWDAKTYQVVKEFESNQGRLFTMVAVSEKQIWTASQKSIKVWDSQSHALIKEIDGFAYSIARVGDVIWVGGEFNIAVYDLEFNQVKKIEVPRNVVMSLCPDNSNKYVWSGTTDKNIFIHVWNAETGELARELSDGHKKKVNFFTVVGDKMWSAGDDNILCVWDCNTFQLLHQLKGHQGAIYGVHTFGDYVWSCGWDTTIRIWDSLSFECVCELTDYHSDCVSSVQAIHNHDGEKCFAWTSSWDKSICVFKATDVRSEEEAKRIASLPTPTNEEDQDKKLEDTEKKMEELKKRNQELAHRSRELQRRRVELEEKKKKLAERREVIENKKKELAQKKTELEEKVHSAQQ